MLRQVALVIGARGGVGSALCDALREGGRYDEVIALGRPELDLTDEASIESAARRIAPGELRLGILATGFLHGPQHQPEKNLKALDAEGLALSFRLNAIGPALVLKHFLPLLPRQGRSAFACISARVGSIGDNRLGGWYGYRASKAALNQFIRTAAIELARTHREALCVALHPGTVRTGLSRPFTRPDQALQEPADSARHLLAVLDGLGPEANGGFFDWRGDAIPW
jgi:NAD(P)-dependent dehydrogenase (short-subunit alcohol dehydrogenase family)